MPQRIRPAAVAGMFYPADPAELNAMLDTMLSPVSGDSPEHPKALVVPHAGYIYSGSTAARAYTLLEAARIRRVILLGPVHRVPMRGLALPDADAFRTPLGNVPLDTAGMQAIAAMPQVCTSAAAHEFEHSLEVQLPFLQRCLYNFTLLPLAVGDTSPEAVAGVLDAQWGGPETLLLISSDLSHFHPYDEAQRIDQATAESIRHLQAPLHHQQACGATPLSGMLWLAGQRHMTCRQLGLCNSGDTSGDKQRVVGYGAFALYEDNHGDRA